MAKNRPSGEKAKVRLIPDWKSNFNRSFPLVRSLACDVPLGDHTAQYNMARKYAKLKASARNPFIDPAGCTYEVDIEEAMYHAIMDEQRKTAGER